jgi:hypothetical protein
VTELRTPPTRPLPALDDEQEVDLGRAWATVVERWWLPVLGLVAGLIVGYLASLGGSQTYKAKTLLYLGQPLAAGGGALPGPPPAQVREVVRAEETVRTVAARTGLHPGELRSSISATPVSGTLPRTGQTATLYTITVKGRAPAKTARAANELAAIAIRKISAPYVDVKIATLRSQIASDKAQLDSINRRIEQEQAVLGSLTGAEKIAAIQLIGFAEQRRATIVDDLLTARPLLAQARTIERGRILVRAVASKATARSHRNSMLVGALLGLILGGVAALAWAPAVARFGRRAPL